MRLLLLFVGFYLFMPQLKSQDLPGFYAKYLERAKYQPIDSLIAEVIMDDPSTEKTALLGELYFFKGRNDLSIQYLDKALIQLQTENKQKEIYCRALSNKGIVLWSEGKPEQALNYLLEALTIRSKSTELSLNILADNYNNLGLVLSYEDDAAAKTYFTKALEIYGKTAKENLDKVIQSTINLSLIEMRNKQYKKALTLLHTALESWKANYSTALPTEAFILVNLANIYLETKNFALAEVHFEEAIQIYSKNYGERNAEIANVYMLMGDLFQTQKNFKTALIYNHKALEANSFTFSSKEFTDYPPIEDAIKPYNQLIILMRKAAIYEDYYYKYSLKKQHLLNALETIKHCDTLIVALRKSRTNKKDQLALSDLAAEVYQDAQRICLRLNEVTLFSQNYDVEALLFSEKAKAISLLSALEESEAKSFAKIPRELTDAENILKNELAYLTTQLSLQNNEQEKSNYRSLLFETKSKYDQLVSKIEKDYPEYYELKYSSNIAHLADIQKVLFHDQAILNYAFDLESDQIYLYFITKDKLKTYTIDGADDIKRYLRAYKNTIIYDLKSDFSQIAYKLFRRLVPFNIPAEINKLSIIPDGELATIPFEALLTSKTGAYSGDDRKNYLIKQYEMNYGFSVTLSINAKQGLYENTAILVAPVSFASDYLSDLPATQLEIENLSSLFTNSKVKINTLLDLDATEENFKNNALAQYKYIHLATHGIVNMETPELSGVFFNNKDLVEDGVLYTSEIYSLNINADLVTLSACETGLGEMKRGEGIIGLGSAFTYAGAKNLLVSVWKVSDASTAGLMTQFYKHSIQENQSYAASLRKAKLELLNSEFSSPFYWASFMLWGD